MLKPVALLALLFAAAVAVGAPVKIGTAIEKQRAKVAAEPTNAGARNDLGNLLVLAGDYRGAEDSYRQALELEPNRAATHFNLGLLLQERNDLATALLRYRKTIDLQPDHAWAHYQSGTIYAKWHLKSLAIRAYAKAIALDPRLGDPHFNPHMIENPYATQAMLRSYRKHVPQAQAPTTFDDAPGIAKMLIFEASPSGEAATAKPAQAPAVAPTARRVSASSLRSGASFEPASATEKPEPPADETESGEEEDGGYLEVKDPDGAALPVGVPVFGVGAAAADNPPSTPTANPTPSSGIAPPTSQPTPTATPRPFSPGTSRPGAGFDPTPTSTGLLTIELTPLAG